MRIAAFLVALSVVLVGIVGIVSPDRVTMVRRQYFATPVGLYAAGAVRVAMGLVLILVARVSRAPKILRTLGALMCAQGLAATVLGLIARKLFSNGRSCIPCFCAPGPSWR